MTLVLEPHNPVYPSFFQEPYLSQYWEGADAGVRRVELINLWVKVLVRLREKMEQLLLPQRQFTDTF